MMLSARALPKKGAAVLAVKTPPLVLLKILDEPC
jgi:hypothetical protein